MIPLAIIFVCLVLMPNEFRNANMLRVAALWFVILTAFGAILR